MSRSTILNQALELAIIAHGDQKDKGGWPYILHPLYVMSHVKSFEGKIVAILHDVIEDTQATLAPGGISVPASMLYPNDTNDSQYNLFYHFPETILAALDAITKRPRESNVDYWKRLATNDLATEVKLVDIAHNSLEERLVYLPLEEAIYLREKYKKAAQFILEQRSRESSPTAEA